MTARNARQVLPQLRDVRSAALLSSHLLLPPGGHGLEKPDDFCRFGWLEHRNPWAKASCISTAPKPVYNTKGAAVVSQRDRRLMALAIRESDVQDRGGGRVVLEEPICLGARRRHRDRETGVGKGTLHVQGNQRFVVNDQDRRFFHERRVAQL